MDGSAPCTAPDEAKRPRLFAWLANEDVDYAEFGRRVGKSREAVRKYCLPFSDPSRQVPGTETLREIRRETRCEIGVEDFYPSDLLRDPEPPPADEDWASRSFLEVADAP